MPLLYIDNQNNWTGIIIVLSLLTLLAVLPERKKRVKAPIVVPMCPYYRKLTPIEQEIYCLLYSLPHDGIIASIIKDTLNQCTIEGFKKVVEFIKSQGSDNPEVMISVVGEHTWKLIQRIEITGSEKPADTRSCSQEGSITF